MKRGHKFLLIFTFISVVVLSVVVYVVNKPDDKKDKKHEKCETVEGD